MECFPAYNEKKYIEIKSVTNNCHWYIYTSYCEYMVPKNIRFVSNGHTWYLRAFLGLDHGGLWGSSMPLKVSIYLQGGKINMTPLAKNLIGQQYVNRCSKWQYDVTSNSKHFFVHLELRLKILEKCDPRAQLLSMIEHIP